MPLGPFMTNEMFEDYRRLTLGDILDQNFGMGLSEELMRPASAAHRLFQIPFRCSYLRPWRHMPPRDSGVSSVKNDKNEYRVSLDVQQFRPEELKVTVEDDFIVVEGKHEERSDEHGFVSRHFTRRYKIPGDVDQSAFVSKLSSDGVLSLEAPKLVNVEDKEVMELPITQTNKPSRMSEDKGEPRPQDSQDSNKT